MKYKDFDLDDFLKDEFFVRWVKNPDKGSDYFWKSWLKQNPGKKPIIDQAARIIKSINLNEHYPSDEETNEVLEGIINKIDENEEKNHNRQVYIKSIFKIAAAFLLLISFYFLLKDAGKENNIKNLNTQSTAVEKSTQKGQKLNFILPDGSEVRLNADSRLVVNADFGLNDRQVFLEGEAFFDVARDTDKVFIIHTYNIKTEVLGTSFNVKAFREDDKINIAVKTGLVQVITDNTKNPSLLSADEMLVYDKEKKDTEILSFDDYEVFGWKDNILYFRNADFKEIQQKLERWYGVEFVTAGSHIEEQFSGSFYSESLEEVIQALNYTSKNRYRLKGKKVYVN